MIDPRRLLDFLAVAETGSFSAAALRLHRSQPAVSRGVAGLERSLGVPLLHRRRDGVVPTEAGRRLLPRAEVVRGQLERAQEEVDGLKRLEGGHVRLGAFPTATGALVLPALRALGAAHPGLEVALVPVGGCGAAARVASGALDVGLAFELHPEPPVLPAEVGATLLHTEELRLAVPAGHPLARGGPVALAGLAGERWVQGAGTESPKLVERAFRALGLEAAIAVESGAAQALVAAGRGVTLVGGRTAPAPGVALVPLAGGPRRDVHLLAAVGVLPPAVAAVAAALRAACADGSGADERA